MRLLIRRFGIGLLLGALGLILTWLLPLAFRKSGSREGNSVNDGLRLFEADDSRLRYTGRIDFTDPKHPRFWASGVYIQAWFTGRSCAIVVNDEVLRGRQHNYLDIEIDKGLPLRIQTTGAENTIQIADGLANGPHTITICKDTEAGIGFLEFVGIRCQSLLPPPPLPTRKLEFIGDSITCGTGSDTSKTPCGMGEWYDQHNAYRSYGPVTARKLDAQWHLTSVSGIGLLHSCCDMQETMPDVWKSLDLKADSRDWDFHLYRPDAVMLCLGQNDGKQDMDAFVERYVTFIRDVRSEYPTAQLVCLTSPMAEGELVSYQEGVLARVIQRCKEAGDSRVCAYTFTRRYHQGCGGHPTLAEHTQIAEELANFLKTALAWNKAKTP